MGRTRHHGDSELQAILAAEEQRFPGLVDDVARREKGEDDQADDDDDVVPTEDIAQVILRRAEMKPLLFDYQQELAEQAVELCQAATPGSRTTGLLSLPTGGGKTRTAISAVLQVMKHQPGARTYWLAPTKELLAQAASTLSDLWHQDGLAPDVVMARCDLMKRIPDFDQSASIVYFATPQMMASRGADEELPRPRLVVFDEAHHVGAPTFRKVLEDFLDSGSSVLGLSATPGRTREEETEALVEFFGGNLLVSEKLRPNALKVLQRRGVLARLVFRDVPTIKGDRRARPVDEFERLVGLTKRQARKGRVLVFVRSVRYGHVLASVLDRVGVRGEVVSAYTEDRRRESILLEYERGELPVVINKALLATGYDCPAINDVVLGTTIRSPILFEQIVGRVARGPAVGGKAKGTVWQFEDHLALHGRPASYHRYEDFDWGE